MDPLITHECRILDEFLVPTAVGSEDRDQGARKQLDQELPAGTAPQPENGDAGSGDTAGKPGRKKRRGQNKNRPVPIKFSRDDRLCPDVLNAANGTSEAAAAAASVVEVQDGGGESGEGDRCGRVETAKSGDPCRFGDRCKFRHDVSSYLQSKPPDIGDECHVFKTLGRCAWGLMCRFGDSHIDRVNGRNLSKEGPPSALTESNHLTKQLLWDLRKNSYSFKTADRVVDSAFKAYDISKSATVPQEGDRDQDGVIAPPSPKMSKVEDICCPVYADDPSAGSGGKGRALDWRDKLYLAPLTTVGNLPFRRICKKFGADITCGEMAMSQPLLTGHQPEWALVQRHESEDIFGIQICGSSPHQMARVAQLVADGHIECSFVDVNLGCPIDLVFRRGMGSGMMNRKKPLEVMVRAMSAVLRSTTSAQQVPLTLKMRTGVYSDKSIAHTLVGPALRDWGASAVTIHGRSREQRYTKLADWDYISKCAEAVPEGCIFGNGDVFNFEDYNRLRESAPKVSGVMIARGALIKPWVFQEIKEQRHLDLSAAERLDMVRDYVNYGLEHWGSDSKGVETTRRFLLEWLSFLHRYVPVGLLAQPPQRMNERVPRYRGRSEMETLLSSPSCQDWIKISEMFLGKVPDNFAFEPKHRANGYK